MTKHTDAIEAAERIVSSECYWAGDTPKTDDEIISNHGRQLAYQLVQLKEALEILGQPSASLSQKDILSLLCEKTDRWALQLTLTSHGDSVSMNLEDIRGAAPFLNKNDAEQLVCDGIMTLFFDSETATYLSFDQVVHDGPTGTNPYNGPCRIYATVWSPKDGLETENT